MGDERANAIASKGEMIPVDPQELFTGEMREEWLGNFYKEAGRETTLAYTTLNQMKNWAMVVAAAALSGLPFGSRSSEFPTPIMFAGTVVVYTLILRFFIRAIICYINLIRWNVLQNDCVQLKLWPSAENKATSAGAREAKLRQDIQNYYFEWLSPLSRKEQLFSNLKLGFYLLFGLALFFLLWGAIGLWHNFVVRGLFVFALLNTGLEFWDFSQSKYFDNPEAWVRHQKSRKHYETFPLPHSRGSFLGLWAVNLAVSTVIALWPSISPFVHKALLRLGSL